jgi:proteasome lid subunit RPN8/RPN11
MSTMMESAPNYIVNWNEVVHHFIKAWPNEACGYVTGDNVFVPCENSADDPLNDFLIKEDVFLGVEPKCIIHSHTIDNSYPIWRQPLPEHWGTEITKENIKDIKFRDEEWDPRAPSASDLQGQIDTDCEWAICVVSKDDCSQPFFWGDFDHRPDLLQRQFIYSMNDCLSFMCDWYYKAYGLRLPNVAREYIFWREANTIFEDNFRKLGFVDVTHLPPEIGDVLLWTYRSKSISHCGIWTLYGVAHHLAGGLPSVLPLEKVKEWNKYLAKRVRHTSNMKPAAGDKNEQHEDRVSTRLAG